MGRLVLAVWLAVFAVQSTNLLAIVLPDECVEVTPDTHGADPCPDNCTGCICCAHRTVVSMPPLDAVFASVPAAVNTTPVTESASNAHPFGILHIPKTR